MAALAECRSSGCCGVCSEAVHYCEKCGDAEVKADGDWCADCEAEVEAEEEVRAELDAIDNGSGYDTREEWEGLR